MVLLFVLLPRLVVTIYALATWWRNRQPSSLESGVDAFRREMSALSPDAAPVQRRPERPTATERADRPERAERPDAAERAERPDRPSGPSGTRPAPRRPQAGPTPPPTGPR
jgi:hypothetical protein